MPMSYTGLTVPCRMKFEKCLPRTTCFIMRCFLIMLRFAVFCMADATAGKELFDCNQCLMGSRAFKPLTAQTIRAHVVGIYPMLESTEQKPWPAKPGRPKLSRADFPVQARLMISNLLYVDKTGFSQAALNAVKRLAAFKNPEFYPPPPLLAKP